MRIGLFIPCYIDAFFPEVGIATLELLGAVWPRRRVPARSDLLRPADGEQRVQRGSAGTEALFVRNFSGFDYVVAPSGSCVHHVRDNFDAIEQTDVGQGGPRANLSSWSSSCTTS